MGEKPLLGREGANVFYYEKNNGVEFAAKGSEHSTFYANSGYVYQQNLNCQVLMECIQLSALGLWGCGLRYGITRRFYCSDGE